MLDVVHARSRLKNEHERTQKNGKCVFCQENRKAPGKNERECGRMSDSRQRGMKRAKNAGLTHEVHKMIHKASEILD